MDEVIVRSTAGVCLEVSAQYKGVVTSVRHLTGDDDYHIGSAPGVDAPVADGYVPFDSYALVTSAAGEPMVTVTPPMRGEVDIDGRTVPLDELVRARGASFALPEGSQARLHCGDSTFVVTPTTAPPRLPRRVLAWQWNVMGYYLGSAAGLGLFLAVMFMVPPDPRSLSLDILSSENHMVRSLIIPPAETPQETPSTNHGDGNERGEEGQRARGEEGKRGKETSSERNKRSAVKGPADNTDVRIARERAAEAARTAGILGALANMNSSEITSAFGGDSTLGRDAEDAIGNLYGTQIGDAYGVGGIGILGTGKGGGGTGEGTIGLGNIGTVGTRSGTGPRYGVGVGRIGRHKPRSPEIIVGSPSVRGSLDKEIIRRIIRRHINEVKYCYEQELTKKPDLAGRLLVQFTIAGTGQVLSSVLQSSSMGNPRVELCTVQAVRRWEFPKPQGGGMVMVSYPFVLAPSGGESH